MVLGIALSRGEEDFSDAEAELLGLARPYLIQAYRNVELSSARTAALRAVESGLETLGRHVVVLDRHGRLEFATDTARRRLGGAGAGRDVLPAEIRDWIVEQRGHLSASEPLVLRIDGAPLLVRLLPRRADDHRDVLLVEGGTGELTVPALRGLGLTERQAQVLQWVVRLLRRQRRGPHGDRAAHRRQAPAARLREARRLVAGGGDRDSVGGGRREPPGLTGSYRRLVCSVSLAFLTRLAALPVACAWVAVKYTCSLPLLLRSLRPLAFSAIVPLRCWPPCRVTDFLPRMTALGFLRFLSSAAALACEPGKQLCPSPRLPSWRCSS
jgi:hypothetical protein